MITTNRRIHFFDIGFYTGLDDQQQPVADPRQVFREIGALHPRAADPNRYLEIQDGEHIYMEVEDFAAGADAIRGVFASKRLRRIPRKERRGQYSNIALQSEEGVAEARHWIFFPNEHLLGMEVNGRGPHTSRFDYYIRQKLDWVTNVPLEMRVAGDVIDTLAKVTRIAGASLGIRRDNIEVLRDLDDDTYRAVKQLAETTNGLEVRVSFELGTRRRDASLDLPWRERLPEFLGGADRREMIEQLKIRGFDIEAGHTRDIDLLADRFIGERAVAVVDDSSNAVVAESMWQAIDEVSRRFRDQ